MVRVKTFIARLVGIALLGAAALPGAAAAHPHVWIDARSEVIFDDQQRMTALRVSWRFDEFYSVFAIEGLDQNGDGELTPAELRPLAELNVTNLKEYRYFTEILADGAAAAYGPVSDYGSRYDDGILTLEFTIPLAAPVDPRRARVAFKSYDPTFYIAIEPALQDPVSLAGTPPASCRAVVEEGSGPSETFSLSEAGSLSDSSALDPNANEGLGALYATTIVLACAPAGVTQ